MLKSASVFSQILSLVSRARFARMTGQLKAERYSKGFSSWDQFVAMVFLQVAQVKSLREITNGLRCCLGKLNHLGLTEAPTKSTLAYANAHRPWQLYREVFYGLLAECQKVAPRKKFRFKNKLLTLDATMVDLCRSMFDWAKYVKTKGAIKLHMLLDHDGHLPTYCYITEGKVHEVRVARTMELPPGSVLVIDRGYTDYELFEGWDDRGVWFVTRLKSNARYTVQADWTEAAKSRNVRSDQIIRLAKTQREFRRLVIWDEKNAEEVVLLTNHMTFAASTVAEIYRARWEIEVFFRTLKQNLKIKTFVGTSANAVKIQIWKALIAILMLKYLQFRSKLGWAMSNLVALVRLNLFTYRDLWAWIDDPYNTPPGSPPCEQLELMLDSRMRVSA